MSSLNKPCRTTLFDILPEELIIQIITQIFRPWSATVDITCQLQPILHTQLLRTCRFFHKEGIRQIKKSFTGEFIRYDRRGCIVDQNLRPTKWYRWIMANTTTLHIHDAGFTMWYVRRYWEAYPKLERFRVTVLQEPTYAYGGDLAVEMPDYLDRRGRCDGRTQQFVEGRYGNHEQLFLESCSAVHNDLRTHGRPEWPLVEYRFHDCRCHPERRTVGFAEWVERLEYEEADTFRSSRYSTKRPGRKSRS